MKIKPRYPYAEEVKLNLSFKSRKILEHYSSYTGFIPAQIIEEVLLRGIFLLIQDVVIKNWNAF
ncbi:hypothetical protein J2S77_002787 [Alkalibacillus salilacus]|uniref:Uncharacterized protein n=1 Tax=Alkalibacillus salilacus TaxID=284582 RepID=A0ABT9VIJ4_9BACI|nr:hypothetical protein [Alkalibacillus salilacus]